MKLGDFTVQLKPIREENEFNEIDLQRLNKELTEMKEELLKASTISFEEDSQTLIGNTRISLSTSTKKRQGQIFSERQKSFL
jgi:hypothetical protein